MDEHTDRRLPAGELRTAHLVDAAERCITRSGRTDLTLRQLCSETGVPLSIVVRHRITVNSILSELVWKAALTARDIRCIASGDPFGAPLGPIVRFLDVHPSIVMLAVHARDQQVRGLAVASIAFLLRDACDVHCARLVAGVLAAPPSTTSAEREERIRRVLTPGKAEDDGAYTGRH